MDEFEIFLGDSEDHKPIVLDDVVSARFVVRLNGVTDMNFCVGFFGDTASSVRGGDDSLVFEYDDTDNGANWVGVAKTSGTATEIVGNSGPSNSTWYAIDFIRISATSFQFYVNEVLVGIATTNVPSVPVGVFASCKTSIGSGSTFDFDLSRVEVVSSGRF